VDRDYRPSGLVATDQTATVDPSTLAEAQLEQPVNAVEPNTTEHAVAVPLYDDLKT